MKIPIKTALLIVFLALFAGLLYYIALNLQNRPNNQSAIEAKTPQTTLSIENTQKDKNGNYYSKVTINTGKNNVTSVQLELSYDNSLLENIKIENGDFFDSSQELINKIDQPNGRITYAISTGDNSIGVSGKGTIAVIYYSPVSKNTDTVSAINFLPKTEATSPDFSGSALTGTYDGIVDIKAALTPTPILNSSPSAATPLFPKTKPTIVVPPTSQ